MNKELTKKDRLAIAKFLNSEPGEQLKGYLAYQSPSITVDPAPHIMHFSSGKNEGWVSCIKMLEDLSSLKGQDDAGEPDDSLQPR